MLESEKTEQQQSGRPDQQRSGGPEPIQTETGRSQEKQYEKQENTY